MRVVAMQAALFGGRVFGGRLLAVTEEAHLFLVLVTAEGAASACGTRFAVGVMAGNASLGPGHLGGNGTVQVAGGGERLVATVVQAGRCRGRSCGQEKREKYRSPQACCDGFFHCALSSFGMMRWERKGAPPFRNLLYILFLPGCKPIIAVLAVKIHRRQRPLAAPGLEPDVNIDKFAFYRGAFQAAIALAVARIA